MIPYLYMYVHRYSVLIHKYCIHDLISILFDFRYSFRKYLETFVKGLFWDASQISAVHPKFYGTRLYRFIKKHFY